MAARTEETESEMETVEGDVMADDVSEEEEVENLTQNTGKQVKYPCLRCKKNVTGKKAVRCNICFLWVHVDCQSISKELFTILKNPGKFGGKVSWHCDSCSAAHERLEAKMDKLEKRFTEVEERVVRNEGSVQDVTKKVDNIEKRQDKVEDLLERERERSRLERVEELRERELRKKNVIMHRIEEAGDWARTVEDRREWDLNSCDNVFKALKMDWGKESVRFCRRVGERSDEPRPMVVGLARENHKEDLLDKARDLRDTAFSEVGIVPDLTKEQRRDESDLAAEAVRRNETRTEEDLAKNLTWRVVGRKGEKRLIKGVERGDSGAWLTVTGRGRRGAVTATATRGTALLPARGRGGTWTPSTGGGAERGGASQRAGAGARGGARGRGMGASTEREAVIEYVRDELSGNRTRLGSNRGRDGDQAEDDQREPPPPPTAAGMTR